MTGLGGAVTAWPLTTQAQQRPLPVVGYVSVVSAETATEREVAFRQGLGEAGYGEGRNVTVEYHILDGKFDRLSTVMADLVRRRVAVIAAQGGAPALAARAATTTIPIVFAVGQDPVKLGLVASLARPGGNATGFNVFNGETQSKVLSILMSWCLRPFMSACSSIRRMPRPPKLTCGRCAMRPAPSGCKSRSSMPARSAKSMLPLPR
jgi:putative ABC transport system substrate-binding protein